ncbi:TPA: class C sortase [Enterococcus faecium]
MKKKNIKLIILKIGMLLCLGVGLYPVITQAYTYYQTQQTLNSYKEKYDEASEKENEEVFNRYSEVNRKRKDTEQTSVTIPEDNNNIPSNVNLQKDKLGELVGEILIPKINVDLPIYDGVNDFQLSAGAGILTGTDYPTGGIGNHSVISAHSGIPNKKYFTDLELLKLGDKFFIDISGKKLAYQVDRIKTILPTEFEDLLPVAGKDYVTLMTCTPVGDNSHRLLVRGVSIPYQKSIVEKEKKKEDLKVKAQMNWYPIVVVGVLLIIAVIVIIKKIVAKRRGMKNEE